MSAVAGASASCRAPWFDTTTPAAPASTHRTASSARCTPFTTTGSDAQPRQPPDVVGRQRRLELVRHHRHEPALTCARCRVAGQVRQRQVVRQVHTRPPLAQPQARHRRVHGQHQRPIPVRRRPRHQVDRPGPLPQHVDLHPAHRLRADRRRHVLQGARRQRRQDQQRPGRRRPPGGRHLALGMRQPLDRRRGDPHGRRHRRPQHRGRRRHRRHPGQDPGVELPASPCLHVARRAAARRRPRPRSTRTPSRR